MDNPFGPAFILKAGVIPFYDQYWQPSSTMASNVAFAAGNFTASSGNWTLTSGDQVSFSYFLLGNMMVVTWSLVTTTVSATPTLLQITVPGGKVAAKRADAVHYYSDNGTAGTGIVAITAGSSTILLGKDSNLTAWSTATNTTSTAGQIIFEVT